jgi:isopentenyl phosphate kinase
MDPTEFAGKKILLLKVGGSSITEKGKLETLNVEALDWFSRAIRSTISDEYLSDDDVESDSDKPAMIIVHGAGSFGHHTAKQYGLRGKSSPPPERMVLTKDLRTGIVETRLR